MLLQEQRFLEAATARAAAATRQPLPEPAFFGTDSSSKPSEQQQQQPQHSCAGGMQSNSSTSSNASSSIESHSSSYSTSSGNVCSSAGVGDGSSTPSDDLAVEVVLLGVVPQWRRRGVASRLIKQVQKHAEMLR
jgi:ribosomal protein S18 acetylase RimI-like enzyme